MNSQVFADTFYWVAVLNPKDQWHKPSLEMRSLLGDIRIVTTETVLIELLNYFSEFGQHARTAEIETVRTIIEDDDVEFLPRCTDTFNHALELYASRPDKRFSLADCIGMLLMKELGLSEVLTHDDHFAQEGFVVLL